MIKTNTDKLDVLLSSRNAEATQLLIKAKTDNLDVLLSTRLAEATFTARLNTLGQKTSALSAPVVIASDQSAIPVTLPSGLQTITSTLAVANGAIAAGAASVSALFSANFSGTFNGVARAKGSFLTLSANEGKTLAGIAYTVAVGSITIDVII